MIAAHFLLVLAAASPAAAPAAKTVAIPVLARPVARGETVSAADFETRDAAPVQAIGIVGPAEAAGREAVRNLAAGTSVRPADLVTPRLVRRGEPVTIAWRSDGLAIVTGGRALSSGGRGELVRVVATATNRTFDTVVEGSGAVAIAGR